MIARHETSACTRRPRGLEAEKTCDVFPTGRCVMFSVLISSLSHDNNVQDWNRAVRMFKLMPANNVFAPNQLLAFVGCFEAVSR